MVNYNGAQAFLLSGVESTYNTPVTANKDLGIIGTVDVTGNNNTIDVRGIGNRESQDLIGGNFDATLSVDGTMNSGAILEMFFAQSTDTETTGDYKHTFLDDDGSETLLNTITSYTIQENYDSSADVTHKWAGCVCNTIDISITLNETVQISAEILAADEDTGTTAGTKVVTSTKALSFAECSLAFGAEASEATLNQVSDFTISLNNSIDLNDIRGIGSRLAQGATPKNLEVTGDFTMKFQDKVQAELFLGGSSAAATTPTDSGLIFQATNGVTLGSGRTELYFRLYGVQIESLGRTVSQDGIVEENFTYRATTVKDAFFVDAVATYF